MYIVNFSPFTGFCYKIVPLPPDDFAEFGATDAIGAGSVQQAVAPDKSSWIAGRQPPTRMQRLTKLQNHKVIRFK